ncbi:MAG: hypothetical protein OEW05_03425 [Candidatus Aminicenantes bacterium]|nr:hypothetical protein [Candidatus Aminicenantes bacterium]
MKRCSCGPTILFLLLGPVVFPQVKTEVRNLTELLMPAGGTYPLPENAVELEPRFTIPFAKGDTASRIKVDAAGRIYALDERTGIVLVFGPAGELLRRLETRGRSAGKPTNPPLLDPEETLVLQDIEARDLVFFDLAGRRLRKSSVPALHDFALDREGRLFTAPYVQDKSNPVIEVYGPNGKKIRGFGRALSFSHSLGMLNSRRLAVMPAGEVAVAFVYLPVLRLYSSGGDLLVEYAVENDIIKAKEAINLKAIGEGIANPARRGLCVKILFAVRTLGESIFLLSNYPRLEILEMDKGGKVRATYWKDFDEVMMPEDFAVTEKDGARHFFVLRSLPLYGIDVYSAAPKK